MAKRKPRSLDEVALPPWKFVVFTDLHVSSETLDRALVVLQRVRQLALEHNARILCLGDFWDQRNMLAVRQLDTLLDEFDQWQRAGIEAVFIPGNHDQVTVSGRVHGVRVFHSYPNITVATEPLLWPERKLAFLPWREDEAEQAQLFSPETVPDGFTVFAHAEAPGAVANSGKTMPGRFGISPRLFAVYLGHFHKRQKIGKQCWYIGSPFEMNMGERGEPHGCAIIEEGKLEPTWIDWDDFPKHHRLIFGEDWGIKYIKPEDVVEVHAAPDEMGSVAFNDAVSAIPAADIRSLPVKNGKEDVPPQFALGLEEALDRWVDESLTEEEHKTHPERAVQLKMLGRELLKQVPEAKTITPMAPYVKVRGVHVHNFCAIRGPLQFDMPSGAALIQGSIAVGKTSLLDAITWCLFGSTTPRKAGSHGASLRADEVVHDDASEAAVTVQLCVGDTDVNITRTKKRGTSPKVVITGVDPGISDHQDQIHRILGIDLDLWRTCVYLGQGAVGTFVTDADQRRKELLSMAFGLNACPPAQKFARDKMKVFLLKAEKIGLELAGDRRVCLVLQETDFADPIKEWEGERTIRLAAIRTTGEQVSATVADCIKHLEAEEAWLSSQQKFQVHLESLVKSLSRQSPQVQAANLQRELGGIQAERSIVERDSVLAKQEMEQHVDGNAACPTCGRVFDPVAREQHSQELERKVQVLQEMLKTFDVKLHNVAVKLDAINTQGSAEREGVEAEIDHCNENLVKCSGALNQFARIKANKTDGERRLHEARAEHAKCEQQINPFLAKQAEKEERVKTLQAKIRADEAELSGIEKQRDDFAFWDKGFGTKGLPVLVLRAALHELELYANQFMAKLLHGRVYCQLTMADDDLKILFFELDEVTRQPRPRRYEQLSGGQRRCIELAFNPFALSEMIFNRCGVRFSLLVVDELTTHLGQAEKPIICDILRSLDRESIVVIDHDPTVQGGFDMVLEMKRNNGVVSVERAV